jgi:hypothetical protein
MIFFCFYPVLATTNKRKHALEQQQQRTCEKTTALEQQEKAHKSDDRGSVT